MSLEEALRVLQTKYTHLEDVVTSDGLCTYLRKEHITAELVTVVSVHYTVFTKH